MNSAGNRSYAILLGSLFKGGSRYLEVGALLLALCVTIFQYRPYSGIKHDSVLYLGQIFQSLWPDVLGEDLFFEFGSQSQYTLFPVVFAPVVEYFGAENAFMYLVLVGRFLFFLASAFLIWKVFPTKLRWLSIFSLSAFPATYGGYSIFSYAEPFFTARTLAEPFALFALFFVLKNRIGLALVCSLVGLMLHPLQVISMGVVCWAYLISGDRRWLHVLWLIPLSILLICQFTSYRDTLFNVYDPEWYSWIIEPNRHVFLTEWRLSDWAYLVTDLFLVSLLYLYSTKVLRRLAISVLLAAAFGFFFSFIFADLLQMVLPAGLQLWRVHWVLHWVAMTSIPWLLFQLYRVRGEWNISLLIALLIVVAGVNHGGLSVPPWIVFILIPLFFLWKREEGKVSPLMTKILFWSLVLALLASCVRYIVFSILIFGDGGYSLEQYRIDSIILAHPVVTFCLIGAISVLWNKGGPLTKRGILILISSSLLYSVYMWDSRSTWTKTLEGSQYVEGVFDVRLPVGSQVYWHEDLLAPWLILKAPSYFTYQQNSGLLFNRGTAAEANFRQKLTAPLFFQKEICQIMNALNGEQDSCSPDPELIVELCEKAKGSLGHVVLEDKIELPISGNWTFSGGSKRSSEVSYYLYACADVLGFAKAGF